MNTTYLQERARLAIAAAEECSDPADKAAYMAAAKAWEQLATGRTAEWSMKPARQALEALKRDVADATGPFARQPNSPTLQPVTPTRNSEFFAPSKVRESSSIEF